MMFILLDSIATSVEVVLWLCLGLIMISIIYFLLMLSGNNTIVVSRPWTSSTIESAGYYHLPKGYVKIEATAQVEIEKDPAGVVVAGRLKQVSFVNEALIVADPNAKYSLSYVSNAFSSDEVTLKTSSKGLLEGINSSAEDRFPQVIAKIAGAPSVILTAQPAASAKALEMVTSNTKEIIEYKKQVVIDSVTKETTVEWKIPVDVGTILVDASFALHNQTVASPPDSTQKVAGEVQGIYSRSLVSALFSISTKGSTWGDAQQQSFLLDLPDSGSLIAIPILRKAGIKRKHELTLTSGCVTSHVINQPSQTEALVSIPIDILKAIVSIPAQLLSFKISSTKQQKLLEDEIKNLQESILSREREEAAREMKNKEEYLKAQQQLVAAENSLKLAQAGVSDMKSFEQKIKELEKKIEELSGR